VQVIRRSDGTSETLYVTTDHLGSTDAVLAASGAVLMRGSFRADGARRASHWQGAPSLGEWTEIANSTREGYTGHEMLDNVMLVHMNGRVFDPQLGRFLSADPYVDGADSTQGWNRYAYVHGRFMSATDPSGFAESALEEMFVMAERIRHAAAGVFSFTAGSASAEAPETGLPMDDATGLEELLVQGARIRPGGAAAVPVTPQAPKPDTCKSAANAPKGLAATNKAFRNNSDPNKRFTVDASQLTVKQTTNFNSNGRAIGVVQGDDWFVHGTVTLQDSGGSISIRPEQYTFEQHNVTSAGEFFRNIETYGGYYVATFGGMSDYWADLTGGNNATDFWFDFTCQPTVVR
jgi:RHS repeat-associated protein